MKNKQALAKGTEGGALAEIESSRAIQEVQAAMVIAKRFPRDEADAQRRIMATCERQSLAEQAIYTYPRGGTKIEGPSIRLAEAIAQNWGNIQFGIREISQEGGTSEVEAFAWDIETNTRQIKTFQVKHERKAYGKIERLEDPRDIYEHVANNGARRLRACVLGIIPGDIVDAAVAQCKHTLTTGGGDPFPKRLADMVKAFDSNFGVPEEVIVDYLGHTIESTNEHELVRLRGVYRSLKDEMSKVEDHFNVEEAKPDPPSREPGEDDGDEEEIAAQGEEK